LNKRKKCEGLGLFSTAKKGGIVSSIQRPNVDIIIVSIVDDSCVHQPSHLAFIFVQFFVVIVHRGFGFFLELRFMSVQVIPESFDTITAEHTEDIPLLLRKLWGSFSAECSEVFSQKLLDAGQTQMSQAWTAVQQSMNTLHPQLNAIAQVDTLKTADGRMMAYLGPCQR
jgi:hypothetical protein